MPKPKIDIPDEEVYKLAKLGATNVEIADFYMCDESVIRRRFAETLAKGRADRRMSIRDKQYEAAMNGNIAMLIWLGKQDLRQSEKLDQHITGDEEKPVVVKILKGVSLDEL